MTSGPSIDYDALAQDAMRGVVRTVLIRTAKSGLPGDHHFYISFDTQAPGVIMSKRLREKYPAEMTIVLQHRFWDLIVSDERFEVKLTFDGIPERLVVPFPALKVFFDPSAQYGLRFEDPDAVQEGPTLGQDNVSGEDATGDRPPMTTRSSSQRKPRAPRKTKSEKDINGGLTPHSHDPAPATPLKPLTARPVVAPVAPHGKAPQPAAASADKDHEGERSPPNLKPVPQPAGSGQVVSLDAFRKK